MIEVFTASKIEIYINTLKDRLKEYNISIVNNAILEENIRRLYKAHRRANVILLDYNFSNNTKELINGLKAINKNLKAIAVSNEVEGMTKELKQLGYSGALLRTADISKIADCIIHVHIGKESFYN